MLNQDFHLSRNQSRFRRDNYCASDSSVAYAAVEEEAEGME